MYNKVGRLKSGEKKIVIPVDEGRKEIQRLRNNEKEEENKVDT